MNHKPKRTASIAYPILVLCGVSLISFGVFTFTNSAELLNSQSQEFMSKPSYRIMPHDVAMLNRQRRNAQSQFVAAVLSTVFGVALTAGGLIGLRVKKPQGKSKLAINQFNEDPSEAIVNNPYHAPTVDNVQAVAPTTVKEFKHAALATRWERLLAALIDVILIWSICATVIAIAFIFQFDFRQNLAPITRNIGDRNTLGMFGLAVYLAINSQLLAFSGQTVGKYILRIQIVSDEGKTIPFLKLIFKRFLLFELPVFFTPVWIGVVIAEHLLIFGLNRKCGHDIVCGSKVIKLSNNPRTGHKR